MTTCTEEEIIEALNTCCTKEQVELATHGGFSKLGTTKRDIAKLFHERNWIEKNMVVNARNFLQEMFGTEESKKEGGYEQKIKDTPVKKITPTDEDKKTDTKPMRKERGKRRTEGTVSLNKFEVLNGYNLISEGIEYNPEASPLKDFPKNKPDYKKGSDVLLHTYLGENYDLYMKEYQEFRNAVEEFLKGNKKIITEPKIFTVSKGVLHYKEVDGKKKKTFALDATNDMTIAYNKFNDFCKRLKDPKENESHVTLTRDMSLDMIMNTDLIYTPDVIDYRHVNHCREETHQFIGCVANADVDIDRVLADLNEEVLDQKPSTSFSSYMSILNFFKGFQLRGFQAKCALVFKNRSEFCMHPALDASTKKEMWLAALNNLKQIKKKNEWQMLWERILQSKFMYYIMMFCIPHAKWLTKGLEHIIKHRDTIKMAMHELYPISFLFTPFMFGNSNVHPDSGPFTEKGLKAAIVKYFDTLLMSKYQTQDEYNDKNFSWLHYTIESLRDSSEEVCNETVSILEHYVDASLTYPKESGNDDDSDEESEQESLKTNKKDEEEPDAKKGKTQKTNKKDEDKPDAKKGKTSKALTKDDESDSEKEEKKGKETSKVTKKGKTSKALVKDDDSDSEQEEKKGKTSKALIKDDESDSEDGAKKDKGLKMTKKFDESDSESDMKSRVSKRSKKDDETKSSVSKRSIKDDDTKSRVSSKSKKDSDIKSRVSKKDDTSDDDSDPKISKKPIKDESSDDEPEEKTKGRNVRQSRKEDTTTKQRAMNARKPASRDSRTKRQTKKKDDSEDEKLINSDSDSDE